MPSTASVSLSPMTLSSISILAPQLQRERRLRQHARPVVLLEDHDVPAVEASRIEPARALHPRAHQVRATRQRLDPARHLLVAQIRVARPQVGVPRRVHMQPAVLHREVAAVPREARDAAPFERLELGVDRDLARPARPRSPRETAARGTSAARNTRSKLRSRPPPQPTCPGSRIHTAASRPSTAPATSRPPRSSRSCRAAHRAPRADCRRRSTDRASA